MFSRILRRGGAVTSGAGLVRGLHGTRVFIERAFMLVVTASLRQQK